MPSTHSTALTFYMFYIYPLLPSLFSSTPQFISQPVTLLNITRVGLTTLWASGLWSRQALGYHTKPQILVGGLLGAGMAFAWKSLWVMGKERGWGIEEGLERLMEGVWGLTVGRILGWRCIRYLDIEWFLCFAKITHSTSLILSTTL